MQQTYLIIIYGIALHFKPGVIFIVSPPFVAAAQHHVEWMVEWHRNQSSVLTSYKRHTIN